MQIRQRFTDSSNLENTSKLLESWKDPDFVESILAETSERTLGLKKNKSIRYRAKDTLDRYIKEVLDEVSELIEIYKHSIEINTENIEFVSKSFIDLQEYASKLKEDIEIYSSPEESTTSSRRSQNIRTITPRNYKQLYINKSKEGFY